MLPPLRCVLRLLLLTMGNVCASHGRCQNLGEMCFHEGDAVLAQSGLALITERAIALYTDWRVVLEYFRAMRMFQLTDKPRVLNRIGVMNAAVKGVWTPGGWLRTD